MTTCPRCGARLPRERLDACPVCLLEVELPPPVVGSVELIEEIGRGGMGIVYKARHLRLGRTVAVKFLSESLAAEPDFRKRFDREARALALLNHPNIVAVHDSGEHDGHPHIIMEYVEGCPLSEKIPLSPEEARAVTLQILDALAYAHGQGIVHRDIKPANILLDPHGRVKVTDFGIARLVAPGGGEWTATEAKGVAGTPHYMAPEALTGAPPDPRMDVYSVGVVLYQMLTGRRPLGQFDPLPAPFDPIVRRAMAQDHERRYATADEMRRALAHASLAGGIGRLPPEERDWLRAVALLQSLATAAALWAFLLSVTPRVLARGEVLPLIMVEGERLADGRVVSWARFETGPALAALGMFALALTAYGLLRRHWRQAGLQSHEPDRPVRQSRMVLGFGSLAAIVYGSRLLREHVWPGATSRYIPILGGAILTLTLFFLWVAVLEAKRVGRPLWREGRLFVGFGLALLPPVVELVRYLLAWRP